MAQLTTHVLDTTSGGPGQGIRIELFSTESSGVPLAISETNADGRCDSPLLAGKEFSTGEYELVFHVGAYFRNRGYEDGEPRFLDRVVIRFGINDANQHYHVPLLVSPFGYSTYRGS
jgi:5-hydroxyisourate hydrolase